jgi:hypothetical protein
MVGMDLRMTGSGDAEWVQLAQERIHWRAVESAVMNLRVLSHGVSYSLASPIAAWPCLVHLRSLCLQSLSR